MSTNSPKSKTLSFRIKPELWERIRVQVFILRTTTQDFCTEAIEKHLARVEKKADDINGAPVRKVLPVLRKPNTNA